MKKINIDRQELRNNIVRYVVIGIAVIIGVVFVIKNIPLGEKKYFLDNERYIKGPRMSFISNEECVDTFDLWFEGGARLSEPNKKCVNQVSFKSFSSNMIVELNRDNMIEEFNQKLCNNSFYIYDNNYVTVTDYGINKGFLFNTYYVKYFVGDSPNYTCLMITDEDKVELLYDYSYKSKDTDKDIYNVDYQYLNSDGNLYDVHTDCGDCLIIKNGTGKASEFKEMLRSSFIDMEMLIRGLEYKVEKGTSKKIKYDDGIMYEHDKIDLLFCNNKEVYISDKIEYDSKMCR